MAEKDLTIKEQLGLWEKASTSNDPQLSIRYLEKYPSGIYSELAEARLNQLLALRGEKGIEIKNSPNNPYSKGTILNREKHYVGDTYTFEERDMISGAVMRTFKHRVTAVEPSQIIFNDGAIITDLLGNDIKSGSRRFLTPTQFYPAVYQVGHRWKTEYYWEGRDGSKILTNEVLKITGREEIETKSGKFNAFVIKSDAVNEKNQSFTRKLWIDPEKCKRAVKRDVVVRDSGSVGRPVTMTEWELVAFNEMK